MGRSNQGSRNGGRSGGRGSGRYQKKTKSNAEKNTTKKYLFTTIESTADVSVSTYETTLKKVYVYLMQNTKEYPADVVDSIKLGSNIEIGKPELKASTLEDPVE